jgi:hypothetical protein
MKFEDAFIFYVPHFLIHPKAGCSSLVGFDKPFFAGGPAISVNQVERTSVRPSRFAWSGFRAVLWLAQYQPINFFHHRNKLTG